MELIDKLAAKYGKPELWHGAERGELLIGTRPRRYRRQWFWRRPDNPNTLIISVLIDEIPVWDRVQDGHIIREPELWDVRLAVPGLREGRWKLPAEPDDAQLAQLAATVFGEL